ncbi:hypothetical protein KEM48_002632 [Puccinia striiformis f. sp. tritici PST-130]|nr:hypothetical protein KEM48_002632 [Puccinia striiformis f. sp. tritici PST-130]
MYCEPPKCSHNPPSRPTPSDNQKASRKINLIKCRNDGFPSTVLLLLFLLFFAYGGFNPPMPTLWQKTASKLLGATMWFFMFYRIREDGAQVFLGRHPWDHGSHGDNLIQANDESSSQDKH